MSGPDRSVTVIVPARNAAATLDRCLTAIAASTCKPVQVLLYDDGSTDSTRRIAEGAGATVIHNPGPPVGPGEGRNRCARQARTKFLVFVDSDMFIHSDAIEYLVSAMESGDNVAAAFGSYDDRPAVTRATAFYANLRHHFIHQNACRRAETFWAGLGIVDRAIFETCGGFDKIYGRPSIEDIELGMRMRAAGHEIVLERAALATHAKNWTVTQLWRTDIYSRALPWSRLILSQCDAPQSLNVEGNERLKAVLAHFTWISVLAGLAWYPLFLAAAASAVWYGFLNRRFWALLARRAGGTGLASGLLLHFAYHIYSSAVFALVASDHAFRCRTSGKRNSTGKHLAERDAGPRRVDGSNR